MKRQTRRQQKTGAAIGAALFLISISPSASRATSSYRIVDLGTLGGVRSAAFGINEAGQVVGTSETADGRQHAFLYDGGSMVDLGTLGGRTSNAYRISDAGVIVGRSETASGTERPFVSIEGGPLFDLSRLGTALGGPFSAALGVNRRGKVVGYLQTPGDHMATRSRVFSYGNYQVLDQGTFGGEDGVVTAINDNDEVVGYFSTEAHADYAHHRGFRLYDGRVEELGTLGGLLVTPADINDRGQVVGSAQLPGGEFRAFLANRGGSMIDLGTLEGGRESFAYAINDAGVIVGASDSPALSLRAIVVRNGQMFDLNALAGPEWVLTEARDINEGGQVVGVGFRHGQQRAFLLRRD